jgi:uncharacterized protein YgiM (DUF1202 family)
MPDHSRPPWHRHSSVLLSASATILVLALVVGYGAWSANGGVVVDEIVVTATRPTPTPAAADPAQVAAARDPNGPQQEESVVWSYTVVPDLLLRTGPTIDAVALRQLEAGTTVEVLDGTAEADGYEWVRVRIEDGTAGWLIAEGIA